MNHRIYLELCLPPDWDRIETVRQAVGLSVEVVLGEPHLKDAIAMVASELLENAVKYGVPDSAIRLVLEEHPDRITVQVTNRLELGADHASVLAHRVAWLQTFEDPRDAYTAALERAFHEAGDGGLGIVRIAYEGRCNIECDLTKPGEVTMTARCERLPFRQPSKGAATLSSSLP